MTRRVRISGAVLATVAAVGVLQSVADAATVYRQGDDSTVSGEVTAMSKTEITIKPKLQSKPAVTIPGNDILRIRWDDEPAALNLSRTHEERGNLTQALEGYQKSKAEFKPTEDEAAADIDFLIARCTAKLALADASRRDAAIAALDGFTKTGSGHIRYFDALRWLGQMYMAKGDLSQARVTYDLMATAPWTDYQMAAKTATARVLLVEKKYDEALTAFDGVVQTKASTPAELSRQQEAMLGKARCLQAKTQHDPAIEVLEKVITEAAPSDTAILAEAYVLQGQSLRQKGEDRDAVLAYLHVDVLFDREQALHAESLYNLSELWAAVGEPGRASSAAARLQQEYPQSEWTKRLSGGN